MDLVYLAPTVTTIVKSHVTFCHNCYKINLCQTIQRLEDRNRDELLSKNTI